MHGNQRVWARMKCRGIRVCRVCGSLFRSPCVGAHAPTHTHVHMHKRAHMTSARTCKCVRMHARKHARPHAHACACARTHTDARAQAPAKLRRASLNSPETEIRRCIRCCGSLLPSWLQGCPRLHRVVDGALGPQDTPPQNPK